MTDIEPAGPPLPADPPRTGDERDVLVAFLEYYRAVLARKAAGLDRVGLATRLEPSALTLGGLLKHMTLVEDTWFVVRFAGRPPSAPWADVDWAASPDWEFDTAAGDEPAALLASYATALETSRSIVAAVDDLGDTGTVGRVSMRWILVHMIEEYARHCGHADLLREAIDGVTGD